MNPINAVCQWFSKLMPGAVYDNSSKLEPEIKPEPPLEVPASTPDSTPAPTVDPR